MERSRSSLHPTLRRHAAPPWQRLSGPSLRLVLGERRASSGLAATRLYLGLHFGDVFFGNIGSRERLDFTVVGPAVNEVSRIASMCRSLDQPVLISARFASALGNDSTRLVSVGRYALRGVGGAQHLFTFEPDMLSTGCYNHP